MHDIAEQYYATVDAAMNKHSSELMAELLAAKVVFDALWVKRMRDFRGETPPEKMKPKEKEAPPEAPPEDQHVVDTPTATSEGTSTSGSIVVHEGDDGSPHVSTELQAGAA